MVEAVPGASWRQLQLHRLCFGRENLGGKDGHQPPLPWFGRTSGSAEPDLAHLATAFGWWACGLLGLLFLVGPT